MPHARRREALRAAVRAAGLDALLVSHLVDVRYLTGFTGSNAALLVHAAGEASSLLCTDGRYTGQAAAQVPDLERVIDRGGAPVLVRAAVAGGARRLGFASDVVTVDAHRALCDAAGPEVMLERAPGMVARLRMVKEPGEIALLGSACAAADAALAGLLEAGGLRAGRTEREVARDLEDRMRDHGAEGPAFATIVASGPYSAVPHHRPTDRPLQRGDLIKIDFGAVVEGYHSDMTRTLVLGPAADWQRDLHALVAAAQQAGRDAARAGAELAAVDAAARTVIAEAGHGADYPHGLGHGVGLEIHEAPLLGAASTGVLGGGTAVTIEPGVYLAGRGGVRIEDTVVVGPGEPRVLTATPRALREL